MSPDGVASDRGTQLAIERTDLAMERTYWAAERTLMGWIRTALSMISFGFAIGKLGEALQGERIKGLLGFAEFSVRGLAVFLVVLGTAALATAAVQYRRRVGRLRAASIEQEAASLALTVSALLCIAGLFAFTALVLRI